MPAFKNKLVNRGGAGLLESGKDGSGKLVNRGPAGLLASEGSSFSPAILEGQAVDRDGAPKDRIRCEGRVVEIARLVPDPNNARLHSERNIDSIMDSLASWGQMKALVVREQDMTVAAGNGTMAAAKRLGWHVLACSVIPMTEAEFLGYALADNRTAELARWDFEVMKRLDKILEEHRQSLVGWTIEEVEVLRRGDFSEPPPPDGSPPEEFPPGAEGDIVPSPEEWAAATLEDEGSEWWDLWQGMPEFTQQDLSPAKSVLVHCRSEEDFAAFLELVGQAKGDVRQRSIWWPRAEIGRFADKRWKQEGGAA